MFIVDESIEKYAYLHTSPEPPLLQELAKETERTMEMPQMLTGRLEGRLLKFLVEISHAEVALEIGTFTGYSALSIAEGLPKGGKIITCEINPLCAEFAKRYFIKSSHGHKIELRLGPALNTIAEVHETLDFVFIDADKENYVAYYEAILPKVRKGGIIAIDNCLWSGRVIDPIDAESLAIAKLNDLIRKDPRVENVMLTVRDGLNLVRKLNA